jgi:hypothetical protein
MRVHQAGCMEELAQYEQRCPDTHLIAYSSHSCLTCTDRQRVESPERRLRDARDEAEQLNFRSDLNAREILHYGAEPAAGR